MRVLKKITNFTGKHLCWSLFLIKLQALLVDTGSNSLSHCRVHPTNIAVEHKKCAAKTAE